VVPPVAGAGAGGGSAVGAPTNNSLDFGQIEVGIALRNNTNNNLYDVWPDASGQFSTTSVISTANPTGTPAKNGSTALSTITSSTTFTVAIWYDQSGNANNLTQSTAAYQPKIITTGTIQTESSKPFIRFYGVDNTSYNSLNLATALTTNGQVSVVNKFVSGGTGFFLGNTNSYIFDWHSDYTNFTKLFDADKDACQKVCDEQITNKIKDENDLMKLLKEKSNIIKKNIVLHGVEFSLVILRFIKRILVLYKSYNTLCLSCSCSYSCSRLSCFSCLSFCMHSCLSFCMCTRFLFTCSRSPSWYMCSTWSLSSMCF
jgi:hypothetical protein